MSLWATLSGSLFGLYWTHRFFMRQLQETIRDYPTLRLPVPDGAEEDFLFLAWCDANRFVRDERDGRYYQNNAWWQNGTMLFFERENNQLYMNLFEQMKWFNGKHYYFALNAPNRWLNKPKRKRKIRQLNKLIKHWHVPAVEID